MRREKGGFLYSPDLLVNWEVEEVETLLSRLQWYVLYDDSKKRVCWKLNNEGVFSVRSM